MERQLFDDAIGAAPPSTVDVDAVIARQRRATLVRRAVAPSAVVAVAVVAVTFGVTMASSGGHGTVDPAGNTATSTTETLSGSPAASTVTADPSAKPSPSSVGAAPGLAPCETVGGPRSETDDQIAARLTAFMAPAVQARVPNAQLSPDPNLGPAYGRPIGPFEFLHSFYDFGITTCQVEGDSFYNMATVTVDGRQGGATAFVRPVFSSAGDELRCHDDLGLQESCRQQTGPGGELVQLSVLHPQDGAVVNSVVVNRPDGTQVSLSASNFVSKDPGNVTTPQPPLAHEQLLDVALDPAFTLNP